MAPEMANIKLCVSPSPGSEQRKERVGDTAVQKWLCLLGQVAGVALQRLCWKVATRMPSAWYMGFIDSVFTGLD